MEGFISHFQIFIHITDAWGTEFYVGIPGSISGSYYLDVYLKILAQSAGKVTVTNGNATSFDSTYDVSKGITTMQIPSTLVHNYAYTYQNMGFRISSTVQVSVIMTTYQEHTMAFDSLLLLPTVVLSTEYVVPFSGDMTVLIAGLENNTHFQTRYQTLNGPSGVLGQYQTYLLHNSSTPDTFSCTISSTKPVAVFLSKTTAGLEQAIPVGNWGKQYVIIPELNTDQSFRILASQNDTHIKVDTSPPWHIIAHSGTRQSNMYGSSLFVDSNQPIMALEYGTAYTHFLTTIPALTSSALVMYFSFPVSEMLVSLGISITLPSFSRQTALTALCSTKSISPYGLTNLARESIRWGRFEF